MQKASTTVMVKGKLWGHLGLRDDPLFRDSRQPESKTFNRAQCFITGKTLVITICTGLGAKDLLLPFSCCKLKVKPSSCTVEILLDGVWCEKWYHRGLISLRPDSFMERWSMRADSHVCHLPYAHEDEKSPVDLATSTNLKFQQLLSEHEFLPIFYSVPKVHESNRLWQRHRKCQQSCAYCKL